MQLTGPPLAPGTTVAGRYRILSLLGQGGMARVYVARDLELERCVALKVLGGGGGDERWSRFRREARNGARLDHPLCARVFDFGRDGGGLGFLATELLDGPSLREVVTERGRLSAAEAAGIGARLCLALAHAHARDVIHRDLKPENIVFRGRGGDPVIIDFGLSLLRDDAPLTAVGSCVGSPTYLAPERVLERDYDGRADLYAVGVILYELVAGAPPFTGRAAADIARRHVIDAPAPLAAVVPGIDLGLAAVIERALAKDPAARCASASEMGRALAPYAAPLAIGSSTDVAGAEVIAELGSGDIEVVAEPVDPFVGASTGQLRGVRLSPPPWWRRVGAWLRYGRWRRRALELEPSARQSYR